MVREKYYAYLKHRVQARHRGEDYSLTWPQWEQLWDDPKWQQRGRRSLSLCLGRLEWDEGWHLHNVRVMTRKEHFEIKRIQQPTRKKRSV
jgi:hypothetical protein